MTSPLSHSLPFLSVVVPAYNRPEGLRALLGALAEQSYPPYRFEVLICDDGSEPPLAGQVVVKDCPFSVRFLREANGGPATARNRGIKEARGAIIAFTDDDCLPEPTWLEAIAEGFADPAVMALHGPTRSAIPPIEPFIHSIHIERHHGVATANFAARKEVLTAVGGFDETFAVPYFEDEDLSRRIQAGFGEIAWREGMRVDHPPRPAPFSKVWRGARFYFYLPYMQRKYPGYWKGAMPAVRKRSLAKAALALVGLSPLVGAPLSFAVAWLVLAAWQLKRLQDLLKRAVSYGVRIPLSGQLQFILLEWLVDFVRWQSYAHGRGLQAKPSPEEELVLE